MQNIYLMQRWGDGVVRMDFLFFPGLMYFFKEEIPTWKIKTFSADNSSLQCFLSLVQSQSPAALPLHHIWVNELSHPAGVHVVRLSLPAATLNIPRLVKKSKLSSINFHPESAVSTFCSLALLGCWGPRTGLALTGKDPATLNSLDCMQWKMVLLASCPGNRLQFA